MSDFPDDPSVAAKRRAYMEQSSSVEAPPLEGSLSRTNLRSSLQNEASWQPSDSERVRVHFAQFFKPLLNSSLEDFTQGLSTYLQSQDLELPDGSLVIFLRNELREAIGQILSKAARRKEITRDALENLHEVLSSVDLELLLKEFGSNFISGLNKDILNGLSISEQIGYFEPLFLIGALSEETVNKTKEQFLEEIRSADPITSLFGNVEQTLKEIDKEFTYLLEELIEGKPRKGVKNFSKISELTKEAKQKAQKKRQIERRFFGALIFVILFAAFHFTGTSLNLNLCLSAGITAILALVSSK